MEKFIYEQLVDIKARQKIVKLFIFGDNKKSILLEQKILGKLSQEDYILIYFTDFTLILFYEQYNTPKKFLKQEGVQFKVMKNRYMRDWHDFIFQYLIGNFKFVLDDCNSEEQVIQILKASQNKKKQQNPVENQVEINHGNEFFNQIDDVSQEIVLENSVKEDVSEMRIESELQRNELENQKKENQKKDEEIVDIKQENSQLRNENTGLRNENASLKRKFGELEKLKDEEIQELNCKYKKQENQFQSLMSAFQIQQNQIQEQQNQMQQQHKDFSEFKEKVENEIASQKKLSMDKQQVIEQQNAKIKEEEISKAEMLVQNEQTLTLQLKKKSMEKNQLIREKDEEMKNQEEELNFREQVINLFVVCLPEGRNLIRERLFNCSNQDLKVNHFTNVQKMEQFINSQYRSTPNKRKKTPVPTPSKQFQFN